MWLIKVFVLFFLLMILDYALVNYINNILVRLSACNTDKLYQLRKALSSIHSPSEQQEDSATMPSYVPTSTEVCVRTRS